MPNRDLVRASLCDLTGVRNSYNMSLSTIVARHAPLASPLSVSLTETLRHVRHVHVPSLHRAYKKKKPKITTSLLQYIYEFFFGFFWRSIKWSLSYFQQKKTFYCTVCQPYTIRTACPLSGTRWNMPTLACLQRATRDTWPRVMQLWWREVYPCDNILTQLHLVLNINGRFEYVPSNTKEMPIQLSNGTKVKVGVLCEWLWVGSWGSQTPHIRSFRKSRI